MKRFIIILLFLAVLLVSCNTTHRETDVVDQKENPYTKDYIYTLFGGTLYKINVQSGNASPMCPDPLCSHDSDNCPFYTVSETGDGIVFTEQYAYYLCGQSNPGGFSNGNNQLRRFDMKNGSYKVLYRADNGTLTNMIFGDNYVFMNLQTINDGKHGYQILRYHLKTDKAVSLTKEPTSDCPRPLEYNDERVIWENADGTLFSTDIDYQNKKEETDYYDSTHSNGNYQYKLSYTGEYADNKYPGNSMSIHELSYINIQTNEEKVLFKTSFTPIIYHDSIIYCKYSPIYIGEIKGDESDTGSSYPQYDSFGGKIYICNADGTGERLLCDIMSEQNLYELPFYTDSILGKMGDGEWVGKWIKRYRKTEDGFIERISNAILLINIVSGEYKICEVK